MSATAAGRATGYLWAYRQPILQGTGLLALAVAVLALFAPGLLAGTALRSVGETVTLGTAVFIGIVAAVAGGYLALQRAPDTDDPAPNIETPEFVHTPLRRTTGEQIDGALERFESQSNHERLVRVAKVRRRLRSLATDLLVAEGDDEATAERRIEGGTWTDDPLAAQFLSPDAVTRGLGERLRDWFRGDRFGRHARATVSELARRAGALHTLADRERPLATGDPVSDRQRVIATPADGVVADGGAVEVRTTSRDRWRVGTVAALLVGGGGVLLGSTAAFVAAGVGVAVAVYGYATRPPTVDLTIEREVSHRDPLPGREVEVAVTVTNEGDRPVADCRVVDGTPRTLPVLDGSPRHATSLRAGESATFRYRVPAYRGEHTFQPTLVTVRNVSATVTRGASVPLATDIGVESLPANPPVAGATTRNVGRVPTDEGGDGVEFHLTRQYVRGDPMRRIDWKRFARTHELTTIDFRETRSVSVLLLLDRRDEAAIARSPTEPSAHDLGAVAADLLAGGLLAENNRVGIAAFGGDGGYVAPNRGRDQRVRLRRFIEAPDALAGTRGYLAGVGGRGTDDLREHLSGETQVVFCSPLCDDDALAAARRLRAHGHDVTVVSPDVTGDTPGGTVERIERRERLDALRAGGITVVDWSVDDPLALAVERAARGGSR